MRNGLRRISVQNRLSALNELSAQVCVNKSEFSALSVLAILLSIIIVIYLYIDNIKSNLLIYTLYGALSAFAQEGSR